MSDYNLDALGWYQFERLCQTILKATIGLAVEAWGGSSDHGRDAYCSDPIDYPNPGATTRGPFVFQAKFVQGANAAGARPRGPLLKAVKAECGRIRERRSAGTWHEPAVYTLLTNTPLSTELRGEVRSELAATLPKATVICQGASDLDAVLDAEPAIRLAYPQILGLRDLTELIHAAVSRDVQARSTLSLERAADLAKVFVPTESYSRALTVLGAHGFVVLTGPPEVGKTTIASIVALSRFTGDWDAIECRDPNDFFQMYDPHRPQVFIADDAFGTTEYRPEIAERWAADLDRILRAADFRHWVIWTSRPGPLNEGLRHLHLQGEAEEFPLPAKVNVEVAALTTTEKALMLYRHCKAAELGDDAVSLVKEHAEFIVRNRHFTPLRIHRFVRRQLPEIVTLPASDQREGIEEAVGSNLREPSRAMETSFNGLDGEHQQLLIAMLDAGSGNVSLDRLVSAFARINGGPPSRPVENLVRSIEDHFLTVETAEGRGL